MSRCVPRGQECGVVRDLLDRLEGLGVRLPTYRSLTPHSLAQLRANPDARVPRLIDALQEHYKEHPEEVREILKRARRADRPWK
jgi:hypothetical protein